MALFVLIFCFCMLPVIFSMRGPKTREDWWEAIAVAGLCAVLIVAVLSLLGVTN